VSTPEDVFEAVLSELLLAFLFECPLTISSIWFCPYAEMGGNMCTLQVLNLTFLNFHFSLICAFGQQLKKKHKYTIKYSASINSVLKDALYFNHWHTSVDTININFL
jgi:hypothetical protein